MYFFIISGVKIVKMNGSSAGLIGTTMTVIQHKILWCTWYPKTGNMNKILEGVQQQMLAKIVTNIFWDTFSYFLCLFLISVFLNVCTDKKDKITIVTDKKL